MNDKIELITLEYKFQYGNKEFNLTKLNRMGLLSKLNIQKIKWNRVETEKICDIEVELKFNERN